MVEPITDKRRPDVANGRATRTFSTTEEHESLDGVRREDDQSAELARLGDENKSLRRALRALAAAASTAAELPAQRTANVTTEQRLANVEAQLAEALVAMRGHLETCPSSATGPLTN